MATFQIIKSDKSTAWYYELKSTSTGETILNSEGYATRSAAVEGIESVKRNAGSDRNYEMKQSVFFSFSLKAINGETIGISKRYTTETERDAVLEMVKKEAPTAIVVL